MADALRSLAMLAAALLVAQMGMGAGCVPGSAWRSARAREVAWEHARRRDASAVPLLEGKAYRLLGICLVSQGVPGGPPGMPCNNARCLATCREYNPSVVRAYCSSTGSCKCEWLQPPHEPCNVLKCDRQCRMDSRKPLMNARCAPNGSCKCTYREVSNAHDH
ncbi:hypothetical protein HPB50_021588 [Hyalomma asiaticum]|uniref:Uncharacterized protein n=1 Tax=Hyalomma asiaticum TaxID=266040 RepID=A0ACB7SSP5_HYAAI|nr:hypothetical protein HPB50_021588 [Hyalomma asiaticum]